MPCANGQDTPTVLLVKFPDALDQVTVDHMHRVRAMAAEGNYRKDVQSSDWIGRAIGEVIGLDPDDEADNKRIKGIIRVWLANGVLAIKQRQDARRRKRPFVGPGNWNEDAAPP